MLALVRDDANLLFVPWMDGWMGTEPRIGLVLAKGHCDIWGRGDHFGWRPPWSDVGGQCLFSFIPSQLPSTDEKHGNRQWSAWCQEVGLEAGAGDRRDGHVRANRWWSLLFYGPLVPIHTRSEVFRNGNILPQNYTALKAGRPSQPVTVRSIILFSHLRLGLPSGLLCSHFPIKILYIPLISPMCATWPTKPDAPCNNFVTSCYSTVRSY